MKELEMIIDLLSKEMDYLQADKVVLIKNNEDLLSDKKNLKEVIEKRDKTIEELKEKLNHYQS